MKIWDVIIIGAGVVGSALARELSKTPLSVLVLEREADSSFGISGRNSGVIHSGIHYAPGSLRADFDVRGNRMMAPLCDALRVPFRRTGKLTAAMTEAEEEKLTALKEQGDANGVPDLKILDHPEMERLQPGISGRAALYSPSTGIISPYGFTIALGEHARENGVEFRFLHRVTAIERQKAHFAVSAAVPNGRVCERGRSVINCAGLFSYDLGKMVGIDDFPIYPCRGEYYVLDKRLKDSLRLLIYPVPGAHAGGLGIHLTLTVEGNILIGPSNEYIDTPEDTATTREVMEALQREGHRLLPALTTGDFIRSFSGIRPKLMPPEEGGYHDFVVQLRKDVPGFIHITGIESPGLTSAPALAEYTADLVREFLPHAREGASACASPGWNPGFPENQAKSIAQESSEGISQRVYRFPSTVSELPESRRRELINEDPDFGSIMCRCEEVSLAEIRSAVNRIQNFGAAVTFTGIKLRTRAMMGRCQGGFCQPRISTFLAQLGIIPEEQWYKGPESPQFFGELRPLSDEPADEPTVQLTDELTDELADEQQTGNDESNSRTDEDHPRNDKHHSRTDEDHPRNDGIHLQNDNIFSRNDNNPPKKRTSSPLKSQDAVQEESGIWDVTVIGGGPAGSAAVLGALQKETQRILLIERDDRLGGILNQCIHDGFGLQRFKETLTGPEYAQRDIEGLQAALESGRISVLTSTFVTALNQDTADADAADFRQSPPGSSSSPQLSHPLLRLKLVSKGSSRIIRSRSAVLAMGCRERTAGAVSLPGTRPAGVFTAGAAQRMMNMQNVFVGKRVMIIGSGDIGLIMARRLSLEGSSVAGVSEIMPFPGGLERNIRQCLHDFSIPLYLHTRAEKIHGKDRVEGVTIRSLDDRDLDGRGNPELYIPCDTVLLSVGLIPENELTRGAGARLSPITGGPEVDGSFMTSVPGLFACGNVLQVHDVVDYVSEEAFSTGSSAAAFAELGRMEESPQPQKDSRIRKFSHPSEADTQDIIPGSEIRYVVPQRFHVPPAEQDRSSDGKSRNEPSGEGSLVLSFRVAKPSGRSIIRVHQAGKQILRRKRVRVHPSEMIRLQVTPLPGIHAPLEVSCEQQ